VIFGLIASTITLDRWLSGWTSGYAHPRPSISQLACCVLLIHEGARS
jgi:hypothetical protein